MLEGEVEFEGQKVPLGLAIDVVWRRVTLDDVNVVDARLLQLGFHSPVPLQALLRLFLPRVLVEPVYPVHEHGIGCHRRWTLELHDCPVFLSALSGDARSLGAQSGVWAVEPHDCRLRGDFSCAGCTGAPLSLVGAATSIIFVATTTNVILSQQKFCRDKLTFVATNTCLSRQNFFRVKNDTCGSSRP